MQYKFYVQDVPDPFPVWQWISLKTNISKYIKDLRPSTDIQSLIDLKHSFNIEEIVSSTLEVTKKFGFKGWRTSEGEYKNYGGLSLTYNPDYTETCDPNQQTLGSDKNSMPQFFYGHVKNFYSVRNTYMDSYGFRYFSPCVEKTKLLEFLKTFKRTIIRSRIGIINAEYVDDNMRKTVGWHKDETIFENLRINIPILTDETFLFQIDGYSAVHLKKGNLYTWDTHIPHRVYPSVQEPRTRIHLVLGFSPWFDYDPIEDAYISNQFFGEMHPIDMLINGHVHENIFGRH